MSIQLISRQSSINEQNLPLLIYIRPLMTFDNEGWTILLVVVCHMFFKVRRSVFVYVVIKISS